MKSQQQRILDLLRQRGEDGVMVYEMMTPRPEGLGIAQYSARIYELRRKGYNIKNVEEGKFVLVSEPMREEKYKVVLDDKTNTARRVKI